MFAFRVSRVLLSLFLFLLAATTAWSITAVQDFTVPNDGNSQTRFKVNDVTYLTTTFTTLNSGSAVNANIDPFSSGGVFANAFGTFKMENTLGTQFGDGTYALTTGRHTQVFLQSSDFTVTVANSLNAADILATISFSNVEIQFNPGGGVGSYGSELSPYFASNSPGVQTFNSGQINSGNVTVLLGTALIDYSPTYEVALSLPDTKSLDLSTLPFVRSHFADYIDVVSGTDQGRFGLEGGVGSFFTATIPGSATGLPFDLDYEYEVQTALVDASPASLAASVIPEPEFYGALLGGLSLVLVLYTRRRQAA